jgi:DNA-binding NarL/FixJ family response regulator
MSQQIQVLLINREHHSELLTALSNCSDVTIIAKASDEASALTLLSENSVDVVLIGVSPPAFDGIDVTKQIRKLHPTARVLMFTTNDSPTDIFSAMDAGADGYVLYKNLSKLLETAVKSVRIGPVWLDPGIASHVLNAIEHGTVTPGSRVLQTGLLRIPLMPDETSLLHDIAESSCKDGVCMVDPSFIKKLKRFG